MIKTDIQVFNDKDDRDRLHVLPCNSDVSYMKMSTQIISHLQLGIMAFDNENQVLQLNQKVCQWLGLSNFGSNHASLESLIGHLDQDQAEYDHLATFLHSSKEKASSIQLEWAVGRGICYFNVSIHPVYNTNKKKSGYYIVFEDVTRQKLLEQQVRHKDGLATIGQMAAGTAHEIRNPLTAIKGFLQVIGHKLQDNGLYKEQSYIEVMQKEIDRINQLVREFLLLSKPRDIRVCTVGVEDLFAEILPIIENEALLYNVSVLIEKNHEAGVNVVADGELLKQVFLNLCKNAIEAMSDGGTLVLRTHQLNDEQKIVVEIEDTGVGMDDALIAQIFDPFFTTKENGTGLGLPICRQILTEIGGEIQVFSHETGSVFQVHLPLAY
ncbi:PAS domain S-box protein [Hazenella sp. IB182357]|uniref:histidine kinase n=1 Tax=Polycladospora coralii TaxID=2771432 RepID=A0A926NAZ4_9BACL|nr:ATP-binding protein [Polycladospora coralii]MBD1371945.1 PAS domain S-box protein [Polycladospora coralii]MBS7530460.1 PAS domain S-box protein [Polycladospora coralii]